MKALIIVAFFICAAYASDVLEFTDANFQDKIKEHDLILVEFYAPWCGHCKRLAPEYEKAATALKDNDPPVPLAKVDCTAESKSCEKYGVSGYPTLKMFRAGELSGDYEGGRDFDGIVKYMKSKAGPSSREIKTVAEAEKFTGHADHGVIGFFSDADSDLAKQFKKLADALNEDFRFAHTSEAAVMDKLGHKDAVVIFQPKRLQNKFEDAQKKYDGDATLHKMKTWVNDNIHGLAGHRTSGNQNQFKKPLVVAYYDVDYVKNPKGTNYWRNRVMKVGKKFTGKNVNFAVSSKDDFTHELSEMGLGDKAGDKPVVAARDSSEQKFVMEGDFSMDNLEKFVNDFLDKKLEPYLKSEPLPDNSNNDVKVAVAKNFQELVNDKSKDVLVEFYAPWCGHCKNLVPVYEELAQKMKKEDGISIVKMDATANDVPQPYQVSGFPTIYFSPKNSKDSPKKYEGGRELKDFINYLAKESTDPLKGWSRDGKKKKKEEL